MPSKKKAAASPDGAAALEYLKRLAKWNGCWLLKQNIGLQEKLTELDPGWTDPRPGMQAAPSSPATGDDGPPVSIGDEEPSG